MNQIQFLGILRDVLKIVGTILGTFGFATDANWALWSGVITTIAPFGWSIYERTQTRMVAQVNAMPEVKGVITAPTPEGVDLAKAIPSPTVVAAGTIAALDVAK